MISLIFLPTRTLNCVIFPIIRPLKSTFPEKSAVLALPIIKNPKRFVNDYGGELSWQIKPPDHFFTGGQAFLPVDIRPDKNL
jgi:hypothetical protein